MRRVVFSSRSEKKLELLINVARELGITVQATNEISDENMALPGGKISQKQLNDWLAKDDGDAEYTAGKVKSFIRKNSTNKKRS